MALNRREFVSVTGVFGAGRLLGQLPTMPPVSTPSYRILEVNCGEAYSGTYAFDLNDLGHLTGSFEDLSSQSRCPFLFRPNATFTGGEFTCVRSLIDDCFRRLTLVGPPAINNGGTMGGCGISRTKGQGAEFVYRINPTQSPSRPWEFEKGAEFEPGISVGDVRINAAGDAVFCARSAAPARDAGARIYAWLPSARDYVDLGPVAPNFRLTGCTRDGARMIICGYDSHAGETRTFRFDYDVVTGAKEIRKLSHSANRHSQALGMNDRGDIVGSCLAQLTKDLAERAFQRSEQRWTMTLGTLGGTRSVAYSINDWGDIVGHSERPMSSVENPVPAAFLFRRFKMLDLATLLQGPAPPALTTAQILINDAGHIAGNVDGPYRAARQGDHAFLLVPN